jgi:hypothetical protein
LSPLLEPHGPPLTPVPGDSTALIEIMLMESTQS